MQSISQVLIFLFWFLAEIKGIITIRQISAGKERLDERFVDSWTADDAVDITVELRAERESGKMKRQS